MRVTIRSFPDPFQAHLRGVTRREHGRAGIPPPARRLAPGHQTN
jgi:hypothetical protein